uniref:Basic proline-rich protein n=1 Tax=Parastrongyloides trichosuri TaxID=131310 RepID=A0A0N4ZKY3_PARTI
MIRSAEALAEARAPPTRQPRQEPLPGDHEPRDPHPPERRDRHAGPDPVVQPHPADPAQRHSGPSPDRVRTAGPEGGSLRSGPRRRRSRPALRRRRARQGPAVHRRGGARSPRLGHGGPRPTETGADQSGLQCGQIHNLRLRQPDRRRRPGAESRDPSLRRAGHRHRLRRPHSRPPVHTVRTGRRRHHPPLWRLRPGAGDFARSGGYDGRRPGLRERTGRGRRLHPDPAVA